MQLLRLLVVSGVYSGSSFKQVPQIGPSPLCDFPLFFLFLPAFVVVFLCPFCVGGISPGYSLQSQFCGRCHSESQTTPPPPPRSKALRRHPFLGHPFPREYYALPFQFACCPFFRTSPSDLTSSPFLRLSPEDEPWPRVVGQHYRFASPCPRPLRFYFAHVVTFCHDSFFFTSCVSLSLTTVLRRSFFQLFSSALAFSMLPGRHPFQ